MNISIDKLRYFQKAAQLEHINNAAKQLNISASSVSDAIKSIENELELQLFKRVKKNIKLTSDGSKILEKINSILNSLNELYTQNESSIVGNFTIGVSLSLFKDSILDLNKVSIFIKNNPKSSIAFNTSDTGKLIDLVINEKLDCALVYSPIKHEKLKEVILTKTNFFIALKKTHPIFKVPKKDRIKLLNSLPAIGFNASVGDNMCLRHPIFDKFGINPNYKYFYDIDEVAVQLINGTNGWIFTSEKIIKANPSVKRLLIDKNWNAPMNISLIWNRDRPRPVFLDYIFRLN